MTTVTDDPPNGPVRASGDDDPGLIEYRRCLVLAEEKAQADFDKTVIYLSAGALGLSFAFIKDIVDVDEMRCAALLLSAWTFWGLSLTFMLASFWASRTALGHAITQVDKKTIWKERPGGKWTRVTLWCNAIGAVLFVLGATLLVFFVHANLGGQNEDRTWIVLRELPASATASAWPYAATGRHPPTWVVST